MDKEQLEDDFQGRDEVHIAIVSLIYPPDLGGSATRASNIAQGLQLRGNEVTVIAGFPHYPHGNIPEGLRTKAFAIEKESGIKVIRTFVPPLASRGLVNRFILFACFMGSSLFALARVRRVDGIFASNPQILAAFPAKVFSTLFRVPMILNVDDLWPETLSDLGFLKEGPLKKVTGRLAKLAYRLADAITPISPSYVPTIVSKYAVRTTKVHVIPGGVDIKLFENQTGPSQHTTFVVLYIGALSRAYDFHQVLHAASSLRGVEAIKFELRGQGEMGPFIQSEIDQTGISNVTLIQSVVSRTEVARLMIDADALLLPLSGTENIEKGISSKLYEYQAAGRPILCCSRGVSRDLVLESGSGLVVEPGDSDALVAAVLRLYDEPLLASKLGQSGRIFVSRYSIEKIGDMASRLLITLRGARGSPD